MKFTLAIVLLTVAATSAAPWWRRMLNRAESDQQKPNFCKSYDCPKYSLVSQTHDYELRSYEATKWVETEMPIAEPYWEDRDGTSTAFRKLFRYISGDNSRDMKIDMTVPVLMAHTEEKVKMAFMLPHSVADDAPTPTDPSVKLFTSPASEVYVRTFSGYAYGILNNKNYYKTEMENLKTALDTAGRSYGAAPFYTAGYNSPWEVFNRHNEVWVIKQ